MKFQTVHVKARAFTLVELLVTLVVAAILASLAVPGFQSTIESNRITSVSERIYSTLQFARGEAVRAGKAVSVCPSVNQTSCATQSDWASGALVFIDDDGNGVLGAGDELLRVVEGGTTGYEVTLISSTSAYFQFSSQGFAEAAGSFQVCGPSANDEDARGIVVRGAGGLRTAMDTDADGIREDHEGNGFQC